MFQRKNDLHHPLVANKGCLLPTIIISNNKSNRPIKYLEHDLMLYVRNGHGLAWIKNADCEYMCKLSYGVSIFLPKDSIIQFKQQSAQALEINIFTLPGNILPPSIQTEEACQTWVISHYPALPEKYQQKLGILPDYIAADGSEGRSMVIGKHGKLNQFTLKPNVISTAVQHSIVEEIWFIESGTGEMWMQQGSNEIIIPLTQGASFVIPVRTAFQFRNISSDENLIAMVLTMPPWPGDHVITFKEGPWEPTVRTPVNANPLHEVLVKKRNDQIQQVSSTLFYNTEQTKAQNDMEAKAALIK